MKKNVLKLLALLAAVSVLPLSCVKPDPGNDEPGPDVPVGPEVPEKQEVNLTMPPAGGELTLDITSTDAWTLAKDENYKWLTISPESAAEAGTVTMTLSAVANESGRERSATLFVMQSKETIYEIFLSQAKMEIPLGEGDYNFLKAIVDGNLLGDDTPAVEDWYSFEGTEFSGTGIDLKNVDGKWYVSRIEGTPFNAFPEAMELPEVEVIRVRDKSATLSGKELPQIWSTPKLWHICLSNDNMTGVIPQGLADSPLLVEIYFDTNDFYGALPHIWASKSLAVVMLGTQNNGTFTGDDPYSGDNQCPYLGYIIPETLDVVLNTNTDVVDKMMFRDKTQFKIGGVRQGHWLGFEKGWGQKRYETYDEAAVAGDKDVWSEWRLLIGTGEDGWAWYFSNVGYAAASGYRTYVPHQMLDWDQSVADAFTAAAKAAHDAGTAIDMTAFGKEPEVVPDDDIAAGNLVEVDENFWGN